MLHLINSHRFVLPFLTSSFLHLGILSSCHIDLSMPRQHFLIFVGSLHHSFANENFCSYPIERTIITKGRMLNMLHFFSLPGVRHEVRGKTSGNWRRYVSALVSSFSITQTCYFLWSISLVCNLQNSFAKKQDNWTSISSACCKSEWK